MKVYEPSANVGALGRSKSSRHRNEFGLTQLQENFCTEYWKDCNGSAAAKRAGYKFRTDRNFRVQVAMLLRNPKIIARMAKTREALALKLHTSTEYVLSHIVRSIERCVQGVPILDAAGNAVMVADEFGARYPALQINERAVLRGCEILGRFLGLGSSMALTGQDGAPLFPQETEASVLDRARRIAFAMQRGFQVINGGKAGLPAPNTVLHQATATSTGD